MKKSNGLKASKLGCLILGICCVIPSVLAGGNTYEINHYVISGGGGLSSGGAYMIQGSIAQVTTGNSIGGIYDLSSGYWYENTDLIFKNSFE